MSWDVKVDAGRCTGDSACVDACPVDVYEMKNNKAVVVNGDECLGCESCLEACEVNAITIAEV